MLFTPFFPSLRARLAACGQRTAAVLHRLDFEPLAEQLRQLLPPELLASADEGPNSRDRIYSLRITFVAFVWQMLKPKTSCREVVRAIQALYKSAERERGHREKVGGAGGADFGDAGRVQALVHRGGDGCHPAGAAGAH